MEFQFSAKFSPERILDLEKLLFEDPSGVWRIVVCFVIILVSFFSPIFFRGLIFRSYIFEYLKYKKKFTIKKDLFESIHYAYARVKNFNQNKKIIVAHEHAPWNCFNYESYFNAKYILIIRDPRASIAGSIKYLQRAKKNQ